MIYIFWTSANKDQAKNIIRALLDKHLIACASIFPVESMYRWKKEIEESSEIKVLLKTTFKHFEAIQMYIKEHSSYEIPEIVYVTLSGADRRYFDWVNNEVCS